jgi:hypothetical protein
MTNTHHAKPQTESDEPSHPSRIFHEQMAVAREFLRPDELAARWRFNVRTLQRWRQFGKGPRWQRLGGRVVYRLNDVVAFETSSDTDAQETS